ncbi:helix-turn-helix domain-containing protein [Mesorhizobium sp. M0843]|uniref:helix-turn-helix domain-containing protein n=1 Tax=Mesorhizobium sp. M0843 TaxID=2957010 RepID=UPI00333A27CA
MSYTDINFVHDLSIPDEDAEDIERAKHVLLYIATRTGSGPGCWASQETMAEQMAMPLRAVERAISLLKKRGLIRTKRRSRKSSIININRQVSTDTTDPPSVGGSIVSPDPSLVGGSEMPVKPPISRSQTATLAADKLNEHAGRSARRRAAPHQGRAGRARLRSDVPERENEGEPSALPSLPDKPVSATEPMSALTGRPASLSLLGSRAADLPHGEEGKTLVQAIIAEAHAETVKRSDPVRLTGPIITAEQRSENEAVARLDAALRQGGSKFYLAAIERLDNDLYARAVVAEIAEPGAGVNLVRSEML